MAFSTSAAASARTASEPPIMVKRRCLRVTRFLWSAHEMIRHHQARILQALIELAQAFVVGNRLARV